MPDLDRLLDTLVAEVTATTRPPGAALVVRQVKRRRMTVAASAALVVVAVTGGLAALTGADSDRVSLIDQPAAPPKASPTEQEGVAGRALSAESFRIGVGETLSEVPGWTLNDSDPTMLTPCAGQWTLNARGGSGGSFDIPSTGARRQVWSQTIGFHTAAQAAGAMAALAQNLASCPTLAWRIQPIARTGALLASSPLGVVWIRQQGAAVATLQAPTADGPPPLDAQVSIAELISSPIG